MTPRFAGSTLAPARGGAVGQQDHRGSPAGRPSVVRAEESDSLYALPIATPTPATSTPPSVTCTSDWGPPAGDRPAAGGAWHRRWGRRHGEEGPAHERDRERLERHHDVGARQPRRAVVDEERQGVHRPADERRPAGDEPALQRRASA